jgi:hypothetical protein
MGTAQPFNHFKSVTRMPNAEAKRRVGCVIHKPTYTKITF